MSKDIHAVLINVGSPSSPKKRDVKRFLKRYLMDRHVMRMPWIFRFVLVRLLIVPLRSGKVSKRYRAIWSDAGSPMIDRTHSLVSKIETKITAKSSGATVSYAMQHGDHSIKEEFKLLSRLGIEEVLVIPQYPQYEASTYLNAVESSRKMAAKYRLKVQFTPPFFAHGDYISALERSVREALTGSQVDKIIYTFHSVPFRYLPCGLKVAEKCDLSSGDDSMRSSYLAAKCEGCYKHQCYATARLVSANIGIEADDYKVVFQSRVGSERWVSPTLNATLSQLPKDGINSVAVIAPSFTVDCVETLDEIAVRGRKVFMDSGGREFKYIPALNDLDLWAKKLSKWIIEANEILKDHE